MADEQHWGKCLRKVIEAKGVRLADIGRKFEFKNPGQSMNDLLKNTSPKYKSLRVIAEALGMKPKMLVAEMEKVAKESEQ